MFKLLKYNFRSMLKIHLYLMGIITISGFTSWIFTTISNNLSDQIYFDIFVSVFNGIFYITLVALVVVTIFLSIKLFYSKVLSDQGYLTNTLPIKSGSIIGSIYLNTIIYIIIDTIFIFLVYNFIGNSFVALGEVGVEGIGYVLLFILLIWIAVILFIGYVYLALSIGYSKNNKISSSVVAGVIIYFSNQFIAAGFVVIIYLLALLTPTLEAFAYLFLGGASFLYLGLGIGTFFLVKYFISNKLNLE